MLLLLSTTRHDFDQTLTMTQTASHKLQQQINYVYFYINWSYNYTSLTSYTLRVLSK